MTGFLGHTATLLADALLSASAGWLVLGVALHLANQAARGCGWHAIVRAVAADGPAPRRLDTVAAWVGGAGAGGVLSARGGDAVRLLLMRGAMPEATCAVLAGTLVAEGVGEMATGTAVLGAGVLAGLGPASDHAGMPGAGVLVAGVSIVVVVALAVRRSARLRRAVRSIAEGASVLGRPAFYGIRVLPWQMASRGLRLASVACLLAAFGLPVSPTAVLLVVVATSGGRLLPFAPASLVASAGILAAGFATTTGTHVDAGQAIAFVVASSVVLTTVGLVLACALLVRGHGSLGQAWVAVRRPAGVPI